MNISRLNPTSSYLTQNTRQKNVSDEKTFQEKKIDGCLTLLDIPVSEKKDKYVTPTKKTDTYDRVELSPMACSGTSDSCHCDVSEAEKVANRRKIDFSGGLQTYGKHDGREYFYLADGTTIPASHVSTKIDPSEILPLEIKDNNLILQKEQYYSFTDHKGNDLLLYTGGDPASLFLGPFSLRAGTTADERQETQGMQTGDMLNCLVECASPLGLYLSYSRSEVNELLDYMGFKTGKMEIGVEGGQGHTFFWTPDRELWGQGEIDHKIQSTNIRNQFECGIPPGSAYIVEGVRYDIDDRGYVHIPFGVMFYPGQVQVVDKDGNILYGK